MGPVAAPLAGARAAAAVPRHFMCVCRVTHNFFVHSVGTHFFYDGDDADFERRYRPEWPSLNTQVTMAEVLSEVRRQREERLRAPIEAEERMAHVQKEYTPLLPEVYRLDSRSQLAPGFHNLIELLRGCGTRPTEVAAAVQGLKAKGLLAELRPGLWSFEVFTEGFCDLLEAELANFASSGLPKTAPNTMNHHGIFMKELGFGPGLLDPFVSEYVDVLASRLLSQFSEGLDSYRAFTVLYEATDGGDRDLAMHYDNAEVTLNINIGGAWGGGQVAFYGLATERESHDSEEGFPVTLRRGHAVFHAGLDLHKALPITSGRRHNLILWCRSSGVRNDFCPMCFRRPTVVPTTQLFDEGFTVPPCEESTAPLGQAAIPDEELYA